MVRLVFMGTPDFAVPSLRYLTARGYPLAQVITQPDRPQGRGQAMAYSAVKRTAIDLGLPVWQPESVNTPEALERLRTVAPDVIVVVAFGQILKPEVLALPKRGCINLHASLLPRYRGAAPVQWAIARGESETGVTVQFMASRVDSGNILVQQSEPIRPDDTAPMLFARLAELGGPALDTALEQIAVDPFWRGVEQDESGVTWAPRLTREDAWIDWPRPAREILNRIRAFTPWPGSTTRCRGEMIKIVTAQPGGSVAGQPLAGQIVSVNSKQGWQVATGEGTLWVDRVQGANTKIMTAHAFSCGHHVGVGDLLA